MRYLPTGEQMREADLHTIEKMGMSSLVLMERAALKVVEIMENEGVDLSRPLIVCGSGNNGGDGYAAARLLFFKGYRAEIFFVGNDMSRSAENRIQKEIAANYHVPTVNTLENGEYSVIVDALFGTGLKREITGDYRDIIERLNQMDGMKVAVDMPSGIHDTTGEVMGTAFQADITVAIAFEKRGLTLGQSGSYAGKVIPADIGITEYSLIRRQENLTYTYEWEDLQKRFPKRKRNSHKGTYGKTLLIAGSNGMSGAAYLSAKAAYAVGTGLVQIYTAEENRVILQQLLPEAIVTTYENYDEEQLKELLSWADVAGIGCGLGKSGTAEKIVRFTMEHAKIPCVVDADALNLLSEHMEWLAESAADIIVTPHLKEMTRLLHCEMSELVEERFERLRKFAEAYGCVTVLKDARTLVAEKGRETYLNLSGNAAMAKGGSGDVLTGMIAGVAAQNVEGYQAACLGVYLHGLAGDAAREKKGAYSVLAGDIIDGIAEVLKKI